ncbi:putative ZNF706/superfamily protein [Arabidopsis thaliana]
MGGGNAQKSAMARAKNLEKAKAAGKGSQLEANKKAMSIQVITYYFISSSSKSSKYYNYWLLESAFLNKNPIIISPLELFM